jgi:hypothetical protein
MTVRHNGPVALVCTRCGRVTDDPDADDTWNVDTVAGFEVGIHCPGCQTPEEDMEAQLHDIEPGGTHWRAGSYTSEEHTKKWIEHFVTVYREPTRLRAAAERLAASELAASQVVNGIDRDFMADFMRRVADAMERTP